MDDLGIFSPPHPDHFNEHPDHRWPAWKLGLGLDDIYTTLPKQFNLMAIPVLDREAFRIEASHIASISRDRAQFFDLLQSQIDLRRKELIDMFMDTLNELAGDPEQLGPAKHWGHAMHIYRYKSLDAFTRFFAGFLRDPKPSTSVPIPSAISPAGRGDGLTPEIEPPSSSPSTVNASSDAPTERPSRARSSVSTTTERQASGTASRTRKRSITTASGSLADDDEAGIPPSKKTRLSPSTSPHRPILPRARRARKGQPSAPNPAGSTITTATTAPSTAPSTSSGRRPGADEPKGIDRSGRCDSASIPQQTSMGNSGQHMGSPLEPLSTNHERGDIEATHGIASTTARAETPQDCATRLRPRKGQRQRRQPPSSASPRIQPSGKIGKPTTRPVPKSTRTSTQKARGRDTTDRTRSSQRLTRRTGQGEQGFRELDSHGKARLVGPSTR